MTGQFTFAHGALEWQVHATYQVVFQAAAEALAKAGFRPKGADPVGGVLWATTGPSLVAWGERITVRIGVPPTGEVRIRVESQLKVGTEVFAAGRHRRNCERFMVALAAPLQALDPRPRHLPPPGSGPQGR